MRIRIAPGLNTVAGYGIWLSILAIVVTAYVSSADAATPFGLIAVFLACLCICIAIRVAGDVGAAK
ncbi:MAG: hypothetical protein P4M07_22455 [Xanthobacteraceae bacterium]|nr:hypothetical protein [Xanthobacteraceae bacterium]